MLNHSARRGFTFIELLVVMGIIILTSTGGLVSYRSFNQRQQLVAAGKQVHQALRTAQTKAQVGDKPDGCGAEALTAYGVTGTLSGRTVRIQAHCGSSGPITVKTFDLNSSVSFTSSFDVRFNNLYGGTNQSSDTSIVVFQTSTSKNYRITVFPAGAISDVGVQ